MNKLVKDWMKGAALAAVVTGAAATTAQADVHIHRRWASSSPVIDGVANAAEWSGSMVTPLAKGRMLTKNDANYLYVLLDVTADTVNNPPAGGGPNTGDWFRLGFDVDLNRAVTPRVDVDFSSCNDGREFVKSYRLSANSTTACLEVDPGSKGKVGFGPTINSAVPHRYWEVRIGLAELGVDTSSWIMSPESVPQVRFNVTTRSEVPAFNVHQPTNELLPDQTNLFALDLAVSPIYPGVGGPIFMGVGLVPSTFIDGTGYANINVPGYYYATNAPFGGDLRIFGRWQTLRFSLGASKYRVLYSKDGGPWQALRQTWTNFKWNGSTWLPIAVGPDAASAYEIPNPWELWYNPNQILGWNSSTFADGTYRLKLELLNGVGAVLPAPVAGNLMTLKVVNTRPEVSLNKVQYDGKDICECGIVTQGSSPKGFSFDITVNDPSGALSAYYLYGNYGHGHSTPYIYFDTYTSGGANLGVPFVVNHINQDGPKKWNGVSNVVVPTGASKWRASKSCAYSFVLSASSRVQNGYGLLWSNITDFQNLTILLGSGAGSTECPDDNVIVRPIDPIVIDPIIKLPIDPIVKPIDPIVKPIDPIVINPIIKF